MSSDVCRVDEMCREGTREQERIGRENPGRGHHVDRKVPVDVRPGARESRIHTFGTYRVDHRMRYKPALATALKPT